MDFQNELLSRQEMIAEMFEQFLPDEEGFQKTVLSAMNYSIRVGGKRLRPIFVLELYKIYAEKNGEEIDIDRIKPAMAAIELLHTYSLVHDDLPAMDNDELRRGKPTTHKKFGHAMGVLAGDALLNYSMETFLKAIVDNEFGGDDEYDDISNAEWNLRVSRAMKVLYTRAGVYGMIGGQTLDVQKNGENLTQEELIYIHQNKTCALISAAIIMGATLGGATYKDIADLEMMGFDIGMAFQIQDDILDVISTDEVLGKPVGSDAKNNKTTYVTLFGMDKAKADVKAYTDAAITVVDSIKVDNASKAFLRELILSLCDRKY